MSDRRSVRWQFFFQLLLNDKGIGLKMRIPDTLLLDAYGNVTLWIGTNRKSTTVENFFTDHNVSNASIREQIIHSALTDEANENKVVALARYDGMSRLLDWDEFHELVTSIHVFAPELSDMSYEHAGTVVRYPFLIQSYVPPLNDSRYVTTFLRNKEDDAYLCESFATSFTERYENKSRKQYYEDLDGSLANQLKALTTQLATYFEQTHGLWIHGMRLEFVRDHKKRIYLLGMESIKWLDKNNRGPPAPPRQSALPGGGGGALTPQIQERLAASGINLNATSIFTSSSSDKHKTVASPMSPHSPVRPTSRSSTSRKAKGPTTSVNSPAHSLLSMPSVTNISPHPSSHHSRGVARYCQQPYVLELSKEVELLTDAKSATELELRSTTQSAQELEREVLRLQLGSEHMRKVFTEMSEELSYRVHAQAIENEELKATISKLEDQLRVLRAQMKAQQADFERQLALERKEKDALAQALAKESEALTKCLKDLERTKEEMRRQQEEAQRRYDSLVQESKAREDALRQESSQLRSELGAVQHKLSEAEEGLAAARKGKVEKAPPPKVVVETPPPPPPIETDELIGELERPADFDPAAIELHGVRINDLLPENEMDRQYIKFYISKLLKSHMMVLHDVFIFYSLCGVSGAEHLTRMTKGAYWRLAREAGLEGKTFKKAALDKIFVVVNRIEDIVEAPEAQWGGAVRKSDSAISMEDALERDELLEFREYLEALIRAAYGIYSGSVDNRFSMLITKNLLPKASRVKRDTSASAQVALPDVRSVLNSFDGPLKQLFANYASLDRRIESVDNSTMNTLEYFQLLRKCSQIDSDLSVARAFQVYVEVLLETKDMLDITATDFPPMTYANFQVLIVKLAFVKVAERKGLKVADRIKTYVAKKLLPRVK